VPCLWSRTPSTTSPAIPLPPVPSPFLPSNPSHVPI